MPKTKFQNVVFTLMMSFLMNDKSGLSDGVSRDDNHVAGRFYPRVFPRGSSGSQISFLHGNTAGSSDRNHAGNFHYDYCYYVSDYEFYCNAAV